jgi:hypothetical protein
LDRAIADTDFVDTAVRINDELPREQAEGFRARLVEFAGLTRQGPFIIE